MPDPTFPAHETYAKGLWPLGHGHALWCPEPSLLFGEVHLGDIGYLRDGHFLFIFNAMRSAADPVNQRGVPDDFEPFTPPTIASVQHCPDQITQKELHSRGMRSIAVSAGVSASEAGASAAASFRYQCTTTSGALLYLRDHGHKTFLDCDRHIKKYMSTHVTSWYQFTTRRLGIDLEEQDLIFISGFTKTSIWSEVAFHNSQSNGELVVSGGCLAPLISGELRVSASQCVDAAVSSRTGPAHRIVTGSAETSTDADKYDQCIFLNYHKAKRKLWRPRILRAAAGPHDLPSADSDNDSCASSIVSSLTSGDSIGILRYNSFDPVASLLEYIIERSEAVVACASDHDLNSLLPNQTIPHDLSHLLESLSPSVEVDTEGMGIVGEAGVAGTVEPRPRRNSITTETGIQDSSQWQFDLDMDVDELSIASPASSNIFDITQQWSDNPFQTHTGTYSPQTFEFATAPWGPPLPSPTREPFMRSRSYSPQLSDSDSINESDGFTTVRPARPVDTSGVREQENHHRPPNPRVKQAPSPWQLFFAEWMEGRKAAGQKVSNLSRAAQDAGREYAALSAAQKEPYLLRARALQEAHERDKKSPALSSEDNRVARRERLERNRARGRRDANAPKKPLSAYFSFLQHIRSDPARVREIFGDETETTKQSVLAAVKWRSMTEEERKPFLAEAEKDKREYEAARQLYEERTSPSGRSVDFSVRPEPMPQVGTSWEGKF